MTDAAHRPPRPQQVLRRAAGHAESLRAGRAWWDEEADSYYAEHGAQLGDAELSWGPEGWTDADLGLLGPLAGRDVLEVGGGAGQGARWCVGQGARAVSTDLSAGMLRVAGRVDARREAGAPTGYVQCDGAQLPFPDTCFDVVFSAHGVLAFIPDAASVLAEWARVLRPGGRCVVSVPHPFRWTFLDVPGEEGLVVRHSYFDRAAYVEQTDAGLATYTEHHRTVGDLVRAVHGAGLVLTDLVEPEWKPGHDVVWGGWSPRRGEVLPGTAVLVCRRPLGVGLSGQRRARSDPPRH